MTFTELDERVRKLKLNNTYIDCNLFCHNYDSPEKFPTKTVGFR